MAQPVTVETLIAEVERHLDLATRASYTPTYESRGGVTMEKTIKQRQTEAEVRKQFAILRTSLAGLLNQAPYTRAGAEADSFNRVFGEGK